MKSKEIKSSDLSMNWALNQQTFVRTSIYTAISNQLIKSRPYICEGCYKQKHNLTVIPVDRKISNPYYRKKAEENHDPNCQYRNPQTYIESIARQYKIRLQDHFVIFDSFRLYFAWKYSTNRSEYFDFLTNHQTASLAYFLGHMVKELEFSSLRSNFRGYYLLSRDNQFKIALDHIIGLQDDIILRVNMAVLKKDLAFIVGTIDRVERNDGKGYIVVHFSICVDGGHIGNTQAFRLYVPSDYLQIVGDLEQLLGRKIGCFGIAEKKDFGNIYQMQLYSIRHQIVYLDLDDMDKLPDQLQIPLEPTVDVSLLPRELTSFISSVWAGVPFNEQQITEFTRYYYTDWFRRLEQEKPHFEVEKKTYNAFLDQESKVSNELIRITHELQNLFIKLDKASQNYRKYDTFINRRLTKWGFSEKLVHLKREKDNAQSDFVACERQRQQVLDKERSIRSSKSEWEDRKEKVVRFEEEVAKIHRLSLWEQQCKQMDDRNSLLLFKFPLQHNYWDLLLVINLSEEASSITLKGRLQIYRNHESSWLPLEQHSDQLEEAKIEVQTSHSQLAKKQLRKFYYQVGEMVKQRIIRLGFPKEKLDCPICGKHTRISFNKINNLLHTVCWDNNCKGSSPILLRDPQ